MPDTERPKKLRHYPRSRGKDAFLRIRLWQVLCC